MLNVGAGAAVVLAGEVDDVGLGVRPGVNVEHASVLDVEPSLAERAVEQFRQYDNQAISLTDHVIGLQAQDYGIDHILTYDDGFRTLGFTVLPRE